MKIHLFTLLFAGFLCALPPAVADTAPSSTPYTFAELAPVSAWSQDDVAWIKAEAELQTP